MEISVVIPTYNRARLLQRCLISVLGQSTPPSEVVVVDDGSTDDTERLVTSIKDDRVRYLRQDRKGANAARNLGAASARGDWLAFQDSDDFWSPDKLQRQTLAIIEASEACDACFCGVLEHAGESASYFPKALPAEPTVFAADSNVIGKVLRHNIISTQTLLVAKSCFVDLGGFDHRLPRFQDWDLAIKLLSSKTVLYLPEPLVIAGKGVDSITRNYEAGLIARRQIWKNHRQLFAEYPMSSVHFWRDLVVRDAARVLRRQ